MKLDEIKAAYVAGKAVPAKYAGEAIAKDPELFFSYLMDNNPAAINNALRLKLGQTFLPFSPNRKAMGGVIHSMILKGDRAGLQVVIDAFKQSGFNEAAANYTTDKELREEITKHLA